MNRLGFILASALLVTGCSWMRVQKAESLSPPVYDAVTDEGPNVAPPPSTPEPQATVKPVRKSAQEIKNPALGKINYPDSWASLNQWSQAQGLGSLERAALPSQPTSSTITNGFKWNNVSLQGTAMIEPYPTFTLRAKSGLLILQSGTRQAYWNGVSVSLGFPPKLVQGELLVRDLDLKNTLEPLLEMPRAPDSARPRTIVIDPGHGGDDTGCISAANREPEKTLTLDWAKRLAQLLERHGYRVTLTRTNDAALSSAQRVKVANDLHADLFVSLHFDFSEGNADLTGVEACCLAPVGVPTGRSHPSVEDPWEVLPNNRYDAQSLRCAFRCQQALVSGLGAPDKGVYRVRYRGILADQERPAVLILGGYLSNPQEAEWIGNAEYRQRLAEALAKGLE